MTVSVQGLSPWIRWALMLERTPNSPETELLRREMLREAARLKLGFCDRGEFTQYISGAS